MYFAGGSDYGYGPSTYMKIIFPGGVANVLLNVPIIDDTIFERSENFAISVVPVSLPYGVDLGSAANTVVTIEDNDCEYN